jgi:hypothetical protein
MILYYINNFCIKCRKTTYHRMGGKTHDLTASSAKFSLVAPAQSLY